MIYVTESIPKQNHQPLKKAINKKSAAEKFKDTRPISDKAQAPRTKPTKSALQAEINSVQLVN